MLKLLILAAAWSFVCGLYQGIVMHEPNVRTHWLFPIYHRTWILVNMFAGIVFIQMDRIIGVVPRLMHYPFLLGLGFLGWELMELGYSYTRYNMLIPEKENILGAGYYVKGLNLQILHIGRLVLASMLLGTVL